MILSKKRITKALIRLHGCAGWSAPVLFANPRRQVFSHRGPYRNAESDHSSQDYEWFEVLQTDKRPFVKPNLGPSCLQRLPADNTSR